MKVTNIEFQEAFFSAKALKVPEKFYWIYENGSRYYVDSKGNIRIGITSFLSKILPENYFLKLWKKEVGEATAAEILKDRANYGTMFHILAASVLKHHKTTGEYVIPLLIHAIDAELKLHGFDAKGHEIIELQKDLAAFASFCEIYKPEAILLEAPLGSKTMPLAATLDFFGWIDIDNYDFHGEETKQGKPKKSHLISRELAIIDFKTMIKKESNEEMNKAISVSNKFQLNYQCLFLTDNYREYFGKGISLFNAVPKNWRTSPSMQLTKIENFLVAALEGLYDASKYIDPYVIEKVSEKKVVEFLAYNGNIADSVRTIDFKQYCMNLINYYNEK